MDFITGSSVWVYLFIFFGKIIEVTIATVRMVLINRGEKLLGSFIAFFEILLWIFITGTVLIGFTEDFVKIVVFALAFAVGNYLGSWLESKVAVGLSSIQVIVPDKCLDKLLSILRENNFGVTVLNGEGKDGKRNILFIHLKRKRINSCIRLIQENIDKCVITVNDVKSIYGGFIRK